MSFFQKNSKNVLEYRHDFLQYAPRTLSEKSEYISMVKIKKIRLMEVTLLIIVTKPVGDTVRIKNSYFELPFISIFTP